MAKGAPSNKVTITQKALDDLKARAGKMEHLKKELAKASKAREIAENKQDALETTVEDLTKSYNDLKQEYDDLAKDAMQKQLTINDLQNNPPVSSIKTASTKAKVDKKDLNQELVNHVTSAAKSVLFRTWKFIEDHVEEEEVTREIIDYLPVELPIPEDEFVANYSNVVYETIKNARTEVQSNGKKRATGKHLLYKMVKFWVIFKCFD